MLNFIASVAVEGPRRGLCDGFSVFPLLLGPDWGAEPEFAAERGWISILRNFEAKIGLWMRVGLNLGAIQIWPAQSCQGGGVGVGGWGGEFQT